VISYLPTPQRAKALSLRADAAFSNLDYNGGPVMPSNTDVLIFWRPSTASAYPAGYQTGLAQYWTDLQTDSGGHQNTDSVATQYNDSNSNFSQYAVTNGGSFNDTQPYPANGCGASAVLPGTTCLIDSQLQAELQRFLPLHSLPEDLNHEYFLVLPPGVVTCFDSNPNDGCDVNANPLYRAYCAYHGNTPYTPNQPVIIYSNELYDVGTGCETGNHPNGPSDGLLDGGMVHEHTESITDPIPNITWTDYTHGNTTGYEIGDKCAYVHGLPLGGTGTPGDPFYNQIINGHHYYYQEEWSNQGHQCLQRFTLSGTEPTATFTASPAGANTVHFDASGSTGGVTRYHWQFEDTIHGFSEAETTSPTINHIYAGGGVHTVSLTVYKSDGTSLGTSQLVGFPSASFTSSPTIPLIGQAVSFNGSSSTQGLHGPITSYSWDFGDGSHGSGPTPSHAYSSTGAYTVTLTVSDGSGWTGSVAHSLFVEEPPTANIAVQTTNAVNGTPVQFSGAGSNDPDGAIISYNWTFGDGSTGTGAAPAHTYSAPGTYTVGLTVLDSSGYTASTAATVTVGKAATISSVRVKRHKLLVDVTGAGTVSYGNKSVQMSGPGTATFKLKLSKHQRNRLKHHHKVKLKVTVKFVPTAGQATSETIRVTLKH
jgi:PKD repeat protein